MKNIAKFLIPLFALQIINACKKDTSNPVEAELAKAEYYQFSIYVDQEIPYHQKVDMVMEEIRDDTIIIHEARIERRGGFSMSYPKFSFEIDLDEDLPLCNLDADDDWILNANYIDKTFMRHVLSYDLFRDMHPNNESSETKFAELTLNDSYNGLYVLMEKLDKSSLGINKKDDQAVIFKEPPIFRFDLEEYVPQYPNNFYQQTYPKKDEQDMTAFIEEVRDFIMSSSITIFSEGVSDIFDIDNIIDWHLLLLLSNNGDGILKNFYLYKVDSNTPLRVAPWDCDYSFGRDGDNELNLIRPADLHRSTLLNRLLELAWYKTALKERWDELNRRNLFTPMGLNRRISRYRITLDGLVEKNFERWPVDNYWYYDDNNYEDEVEIIKVFIEMRHEQLVEYFELLN